MSVIESNVEMSRRALAYAEGFAGAPMQWGVDDCSMFPARWVAELLGRNVDVPSYATDGEAREIIAIHGGLARVWSWIAGRAGIFEVEPSRVRAGDIGVIKTFASGDVGAIFIKYGTVALIRTETGFRMLGIRERNIIAAWRVA